MSLFKNVAFKNVAARSKENSETKRREQTDNPLLFGEAIIYGLSRPIVFKKHLIFTRDAILPQL